MTGISVFQDCQQQLACFINLFTRSDGFISITFLGWITPSDLYRKNIKRRIFPAMMPAFRLTDARNWSLTLTYAPQSDTVTPHTIIQHPGHCLPFFMPFITASLITSSCDPFFLHKFFPNYLNFLVFFSVPGTRPSSDPHEWMTRFRILPPYFHTAFIDSNALNGEGGNVWSLRGCRSCYRDGLIMNVRGCPAILSSPYFGNQFEHCWCHITDLPRPAGRRS